MAAMGAAVMQQTAAQQQAFAAQMAAMQMAAGQRGGPPAGNGAGPVRAGVSSGIMPKAKSSARNRAKPY